MGAAVHPRSLSDRGAGGWRSLAISLVRTIPRADVASPLRIEASKQSHRALSDRFVTFGLHNRIRLWAGSVKIAGRGENGVSDAVYSDCLALRDSAPVGRQSPVGSALRTACS